MIDKSHSLFKLTLIYAAGNFASKILLSVLVFAFTFYLTKGALGEYDLAISCLNLFAPLISLQLQESVLRWILENKYDSSKVFSNVLAAYFCVFVLAGFVILILYQFYPIKYASNLFFLTIFFCVFLLLQQLSRGLGDNKSYILSGVIYSFIYVSISIAGLALFNFSVAQLLNANTFSLIISILFLFSRNNILNLIDWNIISLSTINHLLSYSLPLVPSSVSWWLILSFSKILIFYYLSNEDNGIFAIALRIPIIMMVLMQIFQLAWQEKSIAYFNKPNRNEYFSNTLEKYIVFSFSITILMLIHLKYVFKIIVSDEFYNAWQYSPILLLGILLSSISSFFAACFMSIKMTNLILKSTLYSSLLSIVCSAFMIPFGGIYGASVALLLGFGTLLLIRIKQIRKHFNFNTHSSIIIEYILIYSLISILIYSNYDFSYLISVSIFIFHFLLRNNFKFFASELNKIVDLLKNITKQDDK